MVRPDEALFEENERTKPSSVPRQSSAIPILKLKSGKNIQNAVIAYETWGTLNKDSSNAILICHAVSGDSHAVGWWDRMVGKGKPIDTEKFFVIGSNSLGGCQGSTGPGSLDSAGKRLGSRFPQITVEDMVTAQEALMQTLGVSKLLAVAGGSMGGMQALEWGRRDGVRNVFVSAGAAAHSAMQIGFNEAARQAILRDPNWLGGDYPGSKPPADGLSVARMIGHLSYLSESTFQTKFGRLVQESGDHAGTFQVESYLNYQGDKFTQRFDAGSFINLTRAIDAYECTSLAGSHAEYLFTSYSSDWLYPPHQSEEMHQMALKAGCKSQHVLIDLPFGHDAFLLDAEHAGAAVTKFLA